MTSKKRCVMNCGFANNDPRTIEAAKATCTDCDDVGESLPGAWTFKPDYSFSKAELLEVWIGLKAGNNQAFDRTLIKRAIDLVEMKIGG